MSTELTKIREKIAAIDLQLLDLLNQRNLLTYDVAQYKLDNNRPIRDLEREEKLLAELIKYAKQHEYSLTEDSILRLFKQIISESVNSQQIYIQNN